MISLRRTLLRPLAIAAGLLGAIAPLHAQSAARLTAAAAAESAFVWRTYVALHEHPELGKQEHQTHDLLVRELRRMGYTDFTESRLAPTAVITRLVTGRPGPTIALRAEMDARPTQEPADHTPHSLVPGVMHSCGHDAHAAMLLGTAELLRRNPGPLRGTIVFIFQPAEETKGGADDLVNEGILARLGVQAIFAQHAVSGQPVGTVSVSPGATLAGSSYFTVRVTGRSAHAAQPSAGSDVLLGAAAIARGLAELPARHFDVTTRPVVISPTYLTAGSESATNVLPADALISGTVRAFETPGTGDQADSTIGGVMRSYIDGMSAALGVRAAFELRAGSPPTVNDTALFARLAAPLAMAWGSALDTTPYRGMFSEDFAFYTGTIPALYFGWGIARGPFGFAGVHSADFTVHPAALVEGVRFLATLAETATQ